MRPRSPVPANKARIPTSRKVTRSSGTRAELLNKHVHSETVAAPRSRPASDPFRATPPALQCGVVVIGSINMDLVVRTETMPVPGQTVLGQNLLQHPGGKGANQATAVSRLNGRGGTPVKLIGRIGDDVFGKHMLQTLQKASVDTDAILTTRNIPSGTATILVDRLGENAIVVSPGANRLLTSTDLLAHRHAIEHAAVLAVQLEVPYDTVTCALALARRANVLTILDPAPAPPEGLLEALYHVDILTPNQSESQVLTGVPVRNMEDARRAGERMLQRGARTIVIKLGSQGAAIVEKDSAGAVVATHIPGFRVRVVDTTAAGDAFTGAMAVALSEKLPLPEAVRFANAAGALACLKNGAISSIPTREEVEAFLLDRQ